MEGDFGLIQNTPYSERYDMTRSYRILSREGINKLFTGEYNDSEDVLQGSVERKFGEAVTILTSDSENLYQYSVVSSSANELKKMSLFSNERKKNDCFKTDDAAVICSSAHLDWIINSGLYGDSLRKAMACNLDFNEGGKLEQLHPNFGCRIDGKYLAGYKVVQRENVLASVKEITMDFSSLDDLRTDLFYAEDIIEIIRHYLLESVL